MPSLFASYLRVYEPLTAFDRERQVFWRRYAREGRALGLRARYAWRRKNRKTRQDDCGALGSRHRFVRKARRSAISSGGITLSKADGMVDCVTTVRWRMLRLGMTSVLPA